MADRPILFSAPMVRALLDGRKTQTRRVLNPQVICHPGLVPSFSWGKYSGLYPDDWFGYGNEIDGALPYRPGDRLWVREAWWCGLAKDRIAPRDLAPNSFVAYADHDIGILDSHGRQRAGIHMPRWASRLTLTVTEVRVQRLQEISKEDAIAEGIQPAHLTDGMHGWIPFDAGPAFYDPRDAYLHLWDSLNADRGFGWAANPWCCALTFTVEHGNIDRIGGA